MSSIGVAMLAIVYVVAFSIAPHVGFDPNVWWLLGLVPIVPLGWALDDKMEWSQSGDLR